MKKLNGYSNTSRFIRLITTIALAIGLLFSSYSSKSLAESGQQIKPGDIVTFGHYEQDNNTSNGKEPVKWIVLAMEGSKFFLVSEKNLDCKPYNNASEAVTWETCTLRAWLNNEFLNAAFTVDEQRVIINQTSTNDDNAEYGIDGGQDTNELVYLLSIQQVAGMFTSISGRQSQNTAYAEAHGATTSNGTGWWWLRSPGSSTNRAAYVYHDGSLDLNGNRVNSDWGAVRPSICINMDLTADDYQQERPNSVMVFNISPTQFDITNSSWTGKGPYLASDRKMADNGASYLHAYGSGSGKITYQFYISDENVKNRKTNVTVTARLSSNFPYYTAPDDGYSDVTLFLNGYDIETQRVIPDNGQGKEYTWQFMTDQLLVGDNSFSFNVKNSSTYQNGICVYYDSLKQGVDNAVITVQMEPLSAGSYGGVSFNKQTENLNSNQVIQIVPTQFDEANSSWTGKGPFVESDERIANNGASFLHVYGIGTGKISYTFNVLDGTIAGKSSNISVLARLSSNFPYYTAPADGYSDVTLYLNGQEISTARVTPDNGMGGLHEWLFSFDQLQYGTNTISFVVKESAAYQNGLCIYYKSLTSENNDAAIMVQINVE